MWEVNPWLFLKLELKKAYDHVEWDFWIFLRGGGFWVEMEELDQWLHEVGVLFGDVQW